MMDGEKNEEKMGKKTTKPYIVVFVSDPCTLQLSVKTPYSHLGLGPALPL